MTLISRRWLLQQFLALTIAVSAPMMGSAQDHELVESGYIAVIPDANISNPLDRQDNVAFLGFLGTGAARSQCEQTPTPPGFMTPFSGGILHVAEGNSPFGVLVERRVSDPCDWYQHLCWGRQYIIYGLDSSLPRTGVHTVSTAEEVGGIGDECGDLEYVHLTQAPTATIVFVGLKQFVSTSIPRRPEDPPARFRVTLSPGVDPDSVSLRFKSNGCVRTVACGNGGGSYSGSWDGLLYGEVNQCPPELQVGPNCCYASCDLDIEVHVALTDYYEYEGLLSPWTTEFVFPAPGPRTRARAVSGLEAPSAETPPAAVSAAQLKTTPNTPDSEYGAHGVYLFNGEFHEAVEDMRIAGRGFDFVWARKYRSKLGPRANLLAQYEGGSQDSYGGMPPICPGDPLSGLTYGVLGDWRPLSDVGNGWDYSYNISLEHPCGYESAILLRDGNTRTDMYILQNPNAPDEEKRWVCNGFSREIRRGDPGCYYVLFEDGSRWDFYPIGMGIDGGLGGRLRAISDRNGNTMTFHFGWFSYFGDPAVPEELWRMYGKYVLSSVTDTLGSEIKFHYNWDGLIIGITCGDHYVLYDQGWRQYFGHQGDLLRVEANGRTTEYTYDHPYGGGSGVQLCTGLLTSIKDGNGNVFLTNTYENVNTAGTAHQFRVASQIWGGNGISISYAPSQDGMVATVTDPRGILHKTTWNGANQCVSYDHGGATTSFDWAGKDGDYRLNGITLPSGASVQYSYSGAGGQLQKLSPAQITRASGSSQADGPTLSEQFEYQEGFGGPGFVRKYTDARGNVTVADYDSKGNRTRIAYPDGGMESWAYNQYGQSTQHVFPANGTGVRTDTFTYGGYGSGFLTGVKCGNKVTYGLERDDWGHVTGITDAKGRTGIDWTLNDEIEAISRPLVSPELFLYDNDGNLVSHSSQSNVSSTFSYDALNRLMSAITGGVALNYKRDPNGNATALSLAGGLNSATCTYNQQDRLSVYTMGSGPALTTEIHRNDNGAIVARVDGVGSSAPHRTDYTRDGLDRVVGVIDAEDNLTELGLDENNNVLSSLTTGADGSMARKSGVYDAMNRIKELRLGQDVVTGFDYNHNSQVTGITDPNGHKESCSYDEVNRLASVVNAVGQATAIGYDGNSNVVSVQDPDDPQGFDYDALNRLISASDGLGHEAAYAYNSASDVTKGHHATWISVQLQLHTALLPDGDAAHAHGRSGFHQDCHGHRERSDWPTDLPERSEREQDVVRLRRAESGDEHEVRRPLCCGA